MRKIIVFSLILSTLLLGACELKKSDVSTPKELNPIEKITPTLDESNILKVVIMNALVAKHGSGAKELTISVSKIIGDYSQGGASSSGGGGMWFAAKVNNEWKLVWDGNGVITCPDLIAYPNFPREMIAECYDPKLNKMVVR